MVSKVLNKVNTCLTMCLFLLEEKLDESADVDDSFLQVGSKIAASSVRAQSARMARTKLLATPEEVEEEHV